MNKTLELINGFSDEDAKQFRYFLKCKLFNNRTILPALFESLWSERPWIADHLNEIALNSGNGTKDVSLEMEAFKTRVFQKLSTSQPLNSSPQQKRDDFLRRHFSYLQKCGEKFLVVMNTLDDESAFRWALLKESRSRGMKKITQRTIKEMEGNRLKSSPSRDSAWYLSGLQLATEEGEFSGRGASRGSENIQTQSMTRISERMKAFTSFSAQRWVAIALDHNLNVSTEKRYSPMEISQISRMIVDAPSINDFAWRLYADIAALHKHRNPLSDPQQTEVKDLYLDCVAKDALGQDDLRTIYSLLHNILIRTAFPSHTTPQGKTDTEAQIGFANLFDLYKLGYQEKIILNKTGMVSLPIFKNMIELALKLSPPAVKFAQTFFHERKGKIDSKDNDAEEVLNYSLANLLFFKGDYSSAAKLLAVCKPKDLPLELGIRTLRLKIQVELGNIEKEGLFESQCKSFRQYLRSKKEMKRETRTKYLDRIAKISQLVKALRGKKGAQSDVLHRKLYSDIFFEDKPWMLSIWERKLKEMK